MTTHDLIDIFKNIRLRITCNILVGVKEINKSLSLVNPGLPNITPDDI